ncbi:NADH peroxidase Npx [Lentilactobacillus farraginis DSM 18382 = JCM 14108]|uniref:NADH peroxidase Npx n=1 Tax=Lentilactobacillus farraginis DSM 18382 = JCM 14108 TaxID=1423743 RepID=X0PIZ2_9LACO|nr:NADH peroxidase Npx [Lentilactobacillus farraginis DSM 18382 = JCM 14108]
MKVIVVGSSHGGYEAVRELLATQPDARFNGMRRATLFHFFLAACSCTLKAL